MSTWYIVPSEEDLQHGAFHKYVDKVMGPNGKWRYIYDNAKHAVTRGVNSAYHNVYRRMQQAKAAYGKTKRNVEKSLGIDKHRSYKRAKKGLELAKQSGDKNRISKQSNRTAKAYRDESYKNSLAGKTTHTVNSAKIKANLAYAKTIDNVKDKGLNAYNKAKKSVASAYKKSKVKSAYKKYKKTYNSVNKKKS